MLENNHSSVSAAFSKQSAVFDQLDSDNRLSGHLRSIVRAEVESHLSAESRILELNCGTGLDAVHFAGKGHFVLATDNAPGMVGELEKKVVARGLGKQIETRVLSYHDLSRLTGQTFDHILSNFGGLNCTDRLDEVLRQLPALLNPGGKITLVIMPKVCPWELVMALKGKFSTAFRRFRKNGTPANVEGVRFLCYYYNPSYVTGHLRKEMNVLAVKGIFITVPPEFYSRFVERYPRAYKLLRKVDGFLSGKYPFNRWCDHYMITLQKKPGT